MRRHLRNHTSNTNQEVPDDGARRRRRRSSTSSTCSPVAAMQQPASGMRTQPPGNATHHQVPPPRYDVPSHVTGTSRYYSHYRTHDRGKEYYRMNTDDTEELHASEDPHRSNRPPVPVMRVSETLTEPRGMASRYHGQFAPQQEHQLHRSSSSTSMRTRALTPGSSLHSSSPSTSPSPSLSPVSSSFATPPPSTLASPADSPAVLSRHPPAGKYQYSPSMPYLKTAGDSHVSTALRPVFNAGNTTHQ